MNTELHEGNLHIAADPHSSEHNSHKENIILIGMPGCGKSTIGKPLAEQIGKTFVDADEELVKTFQRSIPDIFATEGEEAFLDKETKVLEALKDRTGLVIATGGGCVTKARNYPLLHKHGIIFWIQRDTAKLPTDVRPLSLSTDLEQMYQDRKPMYEDFADYIVYNPENPEKVVKEIRCLLNQIWDS